MHIFVTHSQILISEKLTHMETIKRTLIFVSPGSEKIYMEENQNWVQALKIPIEKYESWTHDKPKDIPSSYWCLRSDKLEASVYLNWAKNHYQLPVMNSNYKKFNVDTSFWQQLQAVANWSEHMVPLYFWKNTLFILVTEPLDLSWSFPVKYILGTPEQMSYFWNKLSGAPNKTTPVLKQTHSPKVDMPKRASAPIVTTHGLQKKQNETSSQQIPKKQENETLTTASHKNESVANNNPELDLPTDMPAIPQLTAQDDLTPSNANHEVEVVEKTNLLKFSDDEALGTESFNDKHQQEHSQPEHDTLAATSQEVKVTESESPLYQQADDNSTDDQPARTQIMKNPLLAEERNEEKVNAIPSQPIEETNSAVAESGDSLLENFKTQIMKNPLLQDETQNSNDPVTADPFAGLEDLTENNSEKQNANSVNPLESLEGLDDLAAASPSPPNDTGSMDDLANLELGSNSDGLGNLQPESPFIDNIEGLSDEFKQDDINTMPDLNVKDESLQLDSTSNNNNAPPGTDVTETDFFADKGLSEVSVVSGSLQNFLVINQDFQKTLTFEIKDNKLHITHNDGSWNFNPETTIEIKKEPCLFKFCMISKLPFHGTVADMDSIKFDLFSALNIKNDQQHVTLMPLIEGNQPINKFVFTLGDNENLPALQRLQGLAFPILKELS